MKNILLILIFFFLIYLIIKQFTKIWGSTKKESSKSENRPNQAFTQPEKPKSFSDKIPEVKSKDYERAILVKNTTEEYLLNKIKEYGKLLQNVLITEHRFKIAKSVDWQVIVVDNSIDFCSYHNLVGWFTGFEENKNIPEISIGYARHKTNAQLDYIFHLDPKNTDGDTEIGAFNNGILFSIYLPEADKDPGNMVLAKNIKTTFADLKDIIAKNNFDLSKIKSLSYKEFLIEMNE